MRLINFFKGFDGEAPHYAQHAMLAELARGCAREGFTTLVCMHTPPLYPRCLCCESTQELCSMRVQVRGEVVVCLLCSKCQKRVSKPTMLSQMIYEVKCGIINADPRMEMAYLFQHGQRVRIVYGHDIGNEVLS